MRTSASAQQHQQGNSRGAPEVSRVWQRKADRSASSSWCTGHHRHQMVSQQPTQQQPWLPHPPPLTLGNSPSSSNTNLARTGSIQQQQDHPALGLLGSPPDRGEKAFVIGVAGGTQQWEVLNVGGYGPAPRHAPSWRKLRAVVSTHTTMGLLTAHYRHSQRENDSLRPHNPASA